MADKTRIEWTDATWTPIRARDKNTGKVGWHCEHVSDGCRHCYAESMNLRLGTGLPFKPGHRKDIEIFLDENMLTAPLRWKKPRMIFVCSMTDLFADFVETKWIDKMFAVMALCPQHTFQVLTKRHERMREYCSTIQRDGRWLNMEDAALQLGREPRGADNNAFDWIANRQFLPNVWLGVSVENQDEADARIPALLSTPAAIRFVSAEPLLGPVRLDDITIRHSETSDQHIDALHCEEPAADCAAEPWGTRTLDWVIAGGESGPEASPSHPDWFRSLRDQCKAAGVAFHFKQWGAWAPRSNWVEPRGLERVTVMPDGRVREWEAGYPSARLTHPEMRLMGRLGKKAAGRMLDGVEHNSFPTGKD